MEETIKDTTEKLKNGTITIDEANRILLNLFGINNKNFEQPKDRGSCSECGEGYDNEEEWLYNTECELCGHPIPEHLIVRRY